MTNANDPDFQSSKLGTHEYWDEAYNRELESFKDVGDVGEIWFGEETQNRMVRWVTEKSELPPSSKILDLGCGNGMLLIALREEGFTDLTGVDYSEGAIRLSKNIAESEGVNDIKFEACDILAAESITDLCWSGQFDICLDKGTYDAISLHNVNVDDDRRAYIGNVKLLLCEGGLLLITSCNWTQEQLEKQFESDFEVIHEILAPKFTFGGKTGQTVTTLVMRRRSEGS